MTSTWEADSSKATSPKTYDKPSPGFMHTARNWGTTASAISFKPWTWPANYRKGPARKLGSARQAPMTSTWEADSYKATSPKTYDKPSPGFMHTARNWRITAS